MTVQKISVFFFLFWGGVQGVKPWLLLICREKKTHITEVTSKQIVGNTTAGLRRQEEE